MPSACSVGPTKPSTPLLSFLVLLQSEALRSLGPTNFDPKLYVDLPLKHDLALTTSAFSALPRVNGSIPVPDLNFFLKDYFGEVGSDLVEDDPEDFVPEPEGFLEKVENAEVRAWALEVHGLWRNLSRRVSGPVLENPDLHTLLPLAEPVVVPGSRFREIYYWDSYWTIRGLLVSKMYDTAKAIVRNLISLIEVYGFVLNGARAYYTNRSEPPLLSAMVLEIYLKTGDLALVNESLPSLVKELGFWNSGIHSVTIQDSQGHKHSLSRYYAMWNKPRPESATIDEESASNLLNGSQKEKFYREVASTAESGWDFSSRWMSNSSDMTTLATTSIIPVDLNTYIYKMELNIAFFAKLIGDNSMSEKFLEASKARLKAMKSIFWNNEMGQWFDYWLISKNSCEEVHQWNVRNQNHNIYASNFIPLWIQENTSDGTVVEKVLKSLRTSGLIYPAGIATSLSNSGQQWDFPNGWPPLQHMIVEGLVRSNSLEAKYLAEDIAVRWLRTNYVAYKKTGAMQEKYDVQACGKAGGGGEYKIQIFCSEPPLLSAMVLEIYLKTGDLALVNESLPSLVKELGFWNSGIHSVTIQDSQGHKHSLSRYYAMWNMPRPESATIDEESASNLLNGSQKEKFYREVASTAESGWDFSSRWMSNSSDMTTLATTSIIPVDLNTYIYKMELNIAFFAKLIGDNSMSEKFLEASKARLKAMKSIFWNNEMGQWFDYWLISKNSCEEVHQWNVRNQNRNIYASNFIPLWIQENTSDGTVVEKVLKSLRTSGLIYPAGIATSLSNSGQQWDFPNGWPPLQHMIVEGLVRSNSLEAKYLAEDIAVRWLRTNYVAYKKTGAMQEKYDVQACGKAGGGGEYKIQTGFGWSNGVVLGFLEEFGWPADRDIGC